MMVEGSAEAHDGRQDQMTRLSGWVRRLWGNKMSMNLMFAVRGGGAVDFPFQTPTKLTYAVLAAPGKATRLQLLDDAMKEWGWSNTVRVEKMRAIKALMQNPALTLEMI
jgi:hypothetical protein